MKHFSISELWSTSWKQFKANWLLLVLLTILTWAMSFIGKFLSSVGHNGYAAPHVILAGFTGLALMIIGTIIHIGTIKIGLEVADGKKPNAEELLTHTKLFWRFIGVSIIMGSLFVAGIILPLIVGFLFWHGFFHFRFEIVVALVSVLPFLYFLLTFSFAPIILVDKETKVFEALKKSAQISKHNKLSLLGFATAFFVINMFACMILGIGLIVTAPVSFLAFLHLYRKLA